MKIDDFFELRGWIRNKKDIDYLYKMYEYTQTEDFKKQLNEIIERHLPDEVEFKIRVSINNVTLECVLHWTNGLYDEIFMNSIHKEG